MVLFNSNIRISHVIKDVESVCQPEVGGTRLQHTYIRKFIYYKHKNNN